MTIIDPEVHQWMAKRLGTAHCSCLSMALGDWRGGRINAGVLFENWNQASVIAHLAIDGKTSPQFLRSAASYAFDDLGVRKIIAPISSRNERMRRMAEKIGFVVEGTLRDCELGGDIVLMTVNRANCRFMGERYGKKRPATASA